MDLFDPLRVLGDLVQKLGGLSPIGARKAERLDRFRIQLLVPYSFSMFPLNCSSSASGCVWVVSIQGFIVMSSPHGGPAERSCPRHSFHLKELSQSSSRHHRPIPSTGSFALALTRLPSRLPPRKKGAGCVWLSWLFFSFLTLRPPRSLGGRRTSKIKL